MPLLTTQSARSYGFSRYIQSSSTTFDSIATQIASGSGTTITFSSIPSTYKYLQLHCYWAVPTSDTELLIRFNGDSSSTSYNKNQLYANGTTSAFTIATNSYTTNTAIAGPVYYGGSSSAFVSSIVHIYDYAETDKVKTVHTLTGGSVDSAGATQGIFSRMGLWNNPSSAVSSMVLTYTGGSGNILAGSSFALYGIGGN